METLVFVEEGNLDGVDVDIEWNLLPTLGELYTPFVIELKESLLARGKGIIPTGLSSHRSGRPVQ